MKCQCENGHCPHGDKPCTNSAGITLHTIYGKYEMCLGCGQRMPKDAEGIPETIMKTHDDTRRISNMYGSQHATKRIYHRAQRRAAAAVIRSETQGYTAIFQTRYEVQARRVLGSLTFRGERLQFLFKDGWFAVIFPELIPAAEAAHLNRLAHALANTDLKPQPLQVFTEAQL
ncbi:MAG TPA: hypothetical protein VFY05_04675 [Candidatus Angelobacter sp.]|nr:hypothetical protein [Candidatus Angelobacter sp.]